LKRFNVFRETFELTTHQTPVEVQGHIARLLAEEGVKFNATDSTFESSSTPLAFASFHPKFHSRKNWLGLNPFAHITAVNVSWRANEPTGTTVVVGIDRTRAVFLVAAASVLGLLIVAPMLPSVGRMLVVVAVGLFGWLETSVVSGRLVASEFAHALDTQRGKRAA